MGLLKKAVAAALAILCLCHSLFILADGDSEAELDRFFSDRELIARAVEITAPNASYVARLALASVIVNRTKSKRFPNDVRAVLYQRGEFECVLFPDFESCPTSPISRAAARDALLGFDVSSGALYFRHGNIADSDGACFFHSGLIFYKERIN